MPHAEDHGKVDEKAKVTPHATLLDIKIKNLDVSIKRTGEVVNPMSEAFSSSTPKAVTKPSLESFTEEEEDDDGDEESQITQPSPKPVSEVPHVGEKHHKKKGRASRLSVSVTHTSDIEAFEVAENVQPSEVVIICPLPTKDPLIEYRKMYDLMNALGGQKGVDIGGLKVSHRIRQQLLQHENNYSWTDAIQGKIEVCISMIYRMLPVWCIKFFSNFIFISFWK
jgi:hypothetical protein